MTTWLAACRSHGDAARAAAHTRIEDAYTLDPSITYLNHGSIGTIPAVVQRAHADYLALCERNPWFYMWSGEWDEPRERTRTLAARLLGCHADEVALNHNTTEGFSLLAAGLPLGPEDEVLFSSLNHSGASVAWNLRSAERGFKVRQFNFPIERAADLSVDQIVAIYEGHVTAATRVLVVPHIDNLIGLRHPITELCDMARRHGVEFVAVDGAQSLGMLPVDVAATGIDFFCASPHKWVQSPKGTGLMFVKRRVQPQLRAQHATWGQHRWADTARRFEDYGTRDLPATLALGHAIEFQLERGIEQDMATRRALRAHARARVDASRKLTWQSPTSWDVGASLFAIGVRNRPADQVVAQLWPEPGFVVRPFRDPIDAVRVSPNVANSKADLDRLIDRLEQAAG